VLYADDIMAFPEPAAYSSEQNIPLLYKAAIQISWNKNPLNAVTRYPVVAKPFNSWYYLYQLTINRWPQGEIAPSGVVFRINS